MTQAFLPHYDGETDPLTWLNKCDLYFRGASIMDELRYFQLEREHGLVSWEQFVEYLNLRFGPPIRSNSLGELKVLQRTSSVEDYQRQFWRSCVAAMVSLHSTRLTSSL